MTSDLTAKSLVRRNELSLTWGGHPLGGPSRYFHTWREAYDYAYSLACGDDIRGGGFVD